MSKIYKISERAEKEKPELSTDSRKVRGMVHDPRLVSLFQHDSLAAEQFRKLRTYLLRMKISKPPKTILVTSATSGEGKTLVSANLATGIAHDLRSHALLVDCDLRNSALDDWFGLENSKGLSDYLLGNGEISDLLIKTEVEKLSIFPSGSIHDNPTELLGSKKMEALVQELKSRYDDRYVIFDSTPLLTTSEPQVLSKFVDVILVVVKAGVTPRETVKQALSSIEKGKILGLVLNHLQFKSSGLSSRYFGSYGYYYKYGYGKSKAKPQPRWKKLLSSIRKPE
jgi:exopolysaccharide/PEP-CTERM locus tyrosine autokinase